jgi:hypothetical protein
VIVVNRDKGLDITCNQTFLEAVQTTQKYLKQDAKTVGKPTKEEPVRKSEIGMFSAAKYLMYLPTEILYGQNEADYKCRMKNGALEYEYQLVGDVKKPIDFLESDDSSGSENLSNLLLLEIKHIFDIYGSFKSFMNNNQAFVTKVCSIFDLQDDIIFAQCLDYSFGNCGYYKRKPRFQEKN